MATLSDVGVPGSVGPVILQPHHKHRWRIEFLMGGDTRAMTAMAIRADRPKVQFEEIQLDRYNSRVWIFGKHMFDPITITFEPDVGAQVHDSIIEQAEEQQLLIADAGGAWWGQARAGQDYKFAMRMEMLDGSGRQGSTAPLETWLVDGCGISNFDAGDLDYATSETLQSTLTIRYDHARLQTTGRSGLATVRNV
jgi:hypothetical protein